MDLHVTLDGVQITGALMLAMAIYLLGYMHGMPRRHRELDEDGNEL